jgi:hypothetical protein
MMTWLWMKNQKLCQRKKIIAYFEDAITCRYREKLETPQLRQFSSDQDSKPVPVE